MPLNTIEAISARYSCRGFSEKMPSDDDLRIIAGAAAAAPSAMNRQPWQVIVIKNKELVSELEAEGMKNISELPDRNIYKRIVARGGSLFYGAPCMVVLPVKKAEPPGWEMLDCGILTQNIAIAAASLAIDSLICGLAAFSFSGERYEEFKRRLDFADGYEFGIAVLLGYAAEPGGKPHELNMNKINVIE